MSGQGEAQRRRSPFKRKQPATPEVPLPAKLSYSQVDVTERFGDNIGLQPDTWVATVPLNSHSSAPEEMGLPPRGASEDDVFGIASALSRVRESSAIRTLTRACSATAGSSFLR